MGARVSVIGNCQGSPLAEMLRLFFKCEIVHILPVHKAGVLSEEKLDSAIAGSDYVLSQELHETFPLQWLRTSALKERSDSKLLVWQNLYFRGYNPELVYLRPAKGRHYCGPLGDYHIEDVVRGYQKGLAVTEVAAELEDVELNAARYSGVLGSTLEQLRAREKNTVTPVADFIEERCWDRRLFYTFNHPSNALLFRVAVAIGNVIGLRPMEKFRNDIINEKLNEILVPLNSVVRDRAKPTLSDWPLFTGLKFVLSSPCKVTNLKERQFYSRTELVEAFYRIYDFVQMEAAETIG